MRKLAELPKQYATEAEKAMTDTLKNVILRANQDGKELAQKGKSESEIAVAVAEIIREEAPFVQVLIIGGIVQIAFSEHDRFYSFPPDEVREAEPKNIIHFA